MKKRILSGTLAVAMVLSLFAEMSISSYAQVAGFEIGTTPISQKKDYISSDFPEGVLNKEGTISYDPDQNKLTLKNAKINTASENGIEFNSTDKAGTIELIGENTITTDTGKNCIYSEKFGSNAQTLTIKSASGNQDSLKITCGGIYCNKNNLSIKDCNIVSNNTNGCCVYVYGGDLSISGSNLTATGNYGIGTEILEVKHVGEVAVGGNISIADSTVTATGSKKGIYASGGNIGITSSTVTSIGKESGISAELYENAGGKISIADSKVTATATSNLIKDDSSGINTQGDLTITKSNVSVSGGHGLVVLMGDLNIQSGNLTATAKDDNGAAVLVGRAEEQKVGGNINLGTGMFVKTGGIICPNILAGEFTISTIAADKDAVKYIGSGNFTGVAKDVEIRGPGTVSVQQPQKPSNISSVTLPSQTDLQNAVLTDADKAAIANGTDVNIQMVVKNVQAPADADKVKQSLGKNSLGLYLDISILKTVGGVQSEVKQLNNKIRITFTIPENLRGKDKYYVIRVHDGKTTVLEDLDNDPNTVTFETDQFSTYALVYSAKSAKTADNSALISLSLTAVASIGAIAYVQKKKF